MGFFGFGKKEEKAEEKKGSAEAGTEGRYEDACALCGKGPTEKKWMGKYWHKSCMRKSRKFAKGMF